MDNYFNTNEYFNYLKNNFDIGDTSNSNRDETCKRPDIDLILKYIDFLKLQPNHTILEIGCGLGRLLNSLIEKYKVTVSGIDVSESAIEYANRNIKAKKKDIRCGNANSLPFSNNSIDFVICWAVFDLTEQEEVLKEMIRVLKLGGKVLLTGKNDIFMDDDDDALIAEIKSREKNIPNHYTNYKDFFKAVKMIGGEFCLQHFFLRRGDFMKEKYQIQQPEKFIEYCVIIEKKQEISAPRFNFADIYSQTWRKKNG